MQSSKIRAITLIMAMDVEKMHESWYDFEVITSRLPWPGGTSNLYLLDMSSVNNAIASIV